MTQHTEEELQKMIIGALFSSEGELYPEISAIIKPGQFQGQGHVVYSQIEIFYKNRHPVNMQMIIGALGFETYSEYLLGCDGPFEVSGVYHAHLLAEMLQKKRVSKRLDEIKGQISNDFPIDDQLEDVKKLWLAESGHELKKTYDIKSVLSRFHELVKKNEKNGLGHSTGFAWMDDRWMSYQRGHIWLVGGFTSVGKTALLTEMCMRLLSESVPILVISTEMTEEQMVSRLAANRTGINSNVILSGKAHAGREEQIEEFYGWLQTKKITIIDNIRTVPEIYSILRKEQIQGKLGVVFVDYVQNLKLDGNSRYEATAEAATDLQGMAKEFDCTMVCMSQRSNQSVRDDRGMPEYKGGGELAAVADVGIMLMRHKTEKQKMKVEIRKNRHGTTGEFYLEFDDGYTRLHEI